MITNSLIIMIFFSWATVVLLLASILNELKKINEKK